MKLPTERLADPSRTFPEVRELKADIGYRCGPRCNHRGGSPIFRRDLHDQYAKRQVCLILCGVGEVPGLKIVLASFMVQTT
jgi:hypothetical protein